MARQFTAHRPKTVGNTLGGPKATPTKRPAKPIPAEAMANALARKQQADADKDKVLDPATWPEEIGGPSGPEPTRYGDWERKGICVDF